MGEHTPGPWHVCQANNGDCICGIIWDASGQVAVATVHKQDCSFQDHGELTPASVEERRANEILIASAPALRAERDAYLDLLVRVWAFGSPSSVPLWHDIRSALLAAGRITEEGEVVPMTAAECLRSTPRVTDGALEDALGELTEEGEERDGE